jgi:sulfotransferase family protein
MNPFITIVSGLPRSGTSMMMRMLKAGGMDVVADGIRKSDDDNPHGYFEFEKVKKIKEDASWLEATVGKAFKMVSMLLFDLPSDRRYKVIFMKRDINEIMASQRKMLRRHNRDNDGVDDGEMARLSLKHLEQIESWLETQLHIDILYIDYNDVIKRSVENVEMINRFLENTLDVEKMIAAIDTSLYRNRLQKDI